MTTERVLGIDIGASKIAFAIVGSGATQHAERLSIGLHASPLEALRPVLDRLADHVEAHGIFKTIVLAAAPNLDASGRVARWPNRPDWKGMPLVALFSRFASHDIAWCDDGSAATIADARLLDTTTLVHLSLGTGVGGGVYFQGRLLRDREPGHLIVVPDGEPCNCGRRGCLQAYASARSLERHRAEGGSDNAWLNQATRWTAACVANLQELFRPSIVTISGGLGAQFPLFPELVAGHLEREFLKPSAAPPRLMRSPSGDNASLHGALTLAAARESERAANCEVLKLR